MFLLRIFITGLVALVPSYDGTDLTVVIQALRARDPLHIPMLVFPCDNAMMCSFDATQIAANLNLPENIQGGLLVREADKFGAIRLRGAEVVVSPLLGGNLTFVRDRNKRHFFDWIGEVPQDKSEGVDISWLPSMGSIMPQAGTIDPKFLWGPTAVDVAGILRLRGVEGDVKTFSFAKVEEDLPSGDTVTFIRAMSFKPSQGRLGSPRTALADTLVIEIPVSAASLKVVVKPFSGAEVPLDIVPIKGKVDLLLANLAPVAAEDASDDHLSAAAIGAHFALYYRLSRDFDESEGTKIPMLGFWSRRIRADEIEEDAPNIIKVVSLRVNQAGGLHRPICAVATFEQP